VSSSYKNWAPGRCTFFRLRSTCPGRCRRLFSKVIGQGVTDSSDINELVAAAREYLRDKFFRADIGISSANVVAADTGTLFIIENEAIYAWPQGARMHIAPGRLEKLVPSISDATK